MPAIIGILIIFWILRKAVEDARDSAGSRPAGGGDRAASPRLARYGFFDHLRDTYRDYWGRRTDAVVAARNARPARRGWRARWRARRQAAMAAVVAPAAVPTQAPAPLAAAVVTTGTVPATTPATTPVQPPAAAVPAPRTEPALDTTTDPAPDPGPAGTTPAVEPGPPAEPATHPDSDEIPGTDGATEPPAPPTSTGGKPMAATGEAINYETALATLDEMIAETRVQIDAAKAALASMATAKANVDAMQQSYAGEAAATKLDHESALNLDGTTLGHAGTAVDALPVGAVDTLYEATEAVETAVEHRLHQAEVALESLEAEREHLINTYSDAHETVAGNLGGDSRFLNSGQPAPAPSGEPVGAAA